MIKVQDIAFVRFAAPDLDAMQRFAADFGLVLAARENNTLYHRGTDPSPYIHLTELGEAGFRGSHSKQPRPTISSLPRNSRAPPRFRRSRQGEVGR